MIAVAPSILAANFNNLLEEVTSVESAKYLHIDIMDGHFVPNISMGSCVYKNLKNQVNMLFDVHIMISDPLKYANDFINAGADILTFHIEALENQQYQVLDVINCIKEKNVKVGISIKPGTNVQVLAPYLDKVDLVLVMSVEPGFGGQKFMMNSLEKIKWLHQQRNIKKYSYVIEIDGGINLKTAKMAVDAGVDIVVAGTYIFSSNNRKKTIAELEQL